MSNISVYIWGIRKGFVAHEALFPERARISNDKFRLDHYETVVRHFSEAKDGIFRLCDKSFYVLWSDFSFRYYSLVLSSHGDIENRKSYLVFTLVCDKGQVIEGSVCSALEATKNLYKEKNADYSKDLNFFTSDQVYATISGLTIKPLNSGLQPERDKTVILFKDKNHLDKNLTLFTGNELYFIPEDSNTQMRAALESTGVVKGTISIENLIQKNQEDKSNVEEFRKLFSIKTARDERRLQELYTKCSSILSYEEQSLYKQWTTQLDLGRKKDEIVSRFRRLLEAANSGNDKDLLDAEIIWLDHQHMLQETLSIDEFDLFQKLCLEKKERGMKRFRELIGKAKAAGYDYPLSELDEFKILEIELDESYKIDLKKWREFNKNKEEFKIKQEVKDLYSEIRSAGILVRLTRGARWKLKAQSLTKHRLKDTSDDGDYRKQLNYILSARWDSRPHLIIFTALFVLGLASFAWFRKSVDNPIEQNTPATTAHRNTTKQIPDRRLSGPWLLDTMSFPRNDYFTEDGKPISPAIKNLLYSECQITDSSEIELLKALLKSNGDSSTHHVYSLEERKYRVESNRVKNCDGTVISDKSVIDELNQNYGLSIKVSSPAVSSPENPNSTSSQTTFRIEDGRVYNVSRFNSENGLMFNDAYWRYFKNEWKKKEINSNQWTLVVKDEDVNYLLQRNCELVQTNFSPKPSDQALDQNRTSTENRAISNEEKWSEEEVKQFLDQYYEADGSPKCEVIKNNKDLQTRLRRIKQNNNIKNINIKQQLSKLLNCL